jgi:hypothetical protein
MYEICLKLQKQVNIKVFTLPRLLCIVMPEGWGVPKIMARGQGPIISVMPCPEVIALCKM